MSGRATLTEERAVDLRTADVPSVLWIELSSKHFVLDTDVDAAEAGSTLAEFEGIHSAIEDVAFPSDVEARTPIRVVLFAREKDYRPLAPKDTAGYFMPQLPNDLDGVPTMVMWGGLVEATRTTFQHELTHLFVRREHWGTGLAVTLHDLMLDSMRERGFTSAVLWTPIGAARSRAFYAREGWSETGALEPDSDLGLKLMEYAIQL